jgi:hypothetical protein
MSNKIEEISRNEKVSLYCYNRLSRKVDWESSDLKRYVSELRLKIFYMGMSNKSHWDKCMTLRVIKQLEFLNNTIAVINLSGGIDVLNYCLSKHLKKMVSLDPYHYSWSMCPFGALTNLDLRAPSEYDRTSLEFKKMDAR